MPSPREVLTAMRAVGLAHRCPVCRLPLRTFVEAAPGGRPLARCPRCASLERHRHLWLFLERHTTLPGDRSASVLHFAPERGLGARLSRRAHYVSADLEPGVATMQLDVQKLALPDKSFDWVLCSHVLEHVPDDRAAMAELHRILRPGGTAIIQVPMFGETTDEDASLDPSERLRRFGQDDHVRTYGRDFFDRLRAAGFDLELRLFRDELTPRERARFGLDYHGVPDAYARSDELWTVPLCHRSAT